MQENYEQVYNDKKNPKYVDLLDEDKAIAGQKFVCLSFISPEKILKEKQRFFFQEFLKNYDFEKSLEKFTQFVNFLTFKYKLNADNLNNDLKEFVLSERKTLQSESVEEDYKNFIDQYEDKLEEQFSSLNAYQTSTRGIKVRGVFPNQQEAELRCKMLRELDPNHDVYVGQVGLWMPWEPEAYKTGKVEYLEDELNQLMHEKEENEKKAKLEFDKRIKETKERAIEDNKKKAEASGNKLSQNIDEKGNLYSVNTKGEREELSVADIKKELFENENVVLDKNTDHGFSELTMNKNDDDEMNNVD
tara:strand:- start:1407 stop:2315 length:909 start_codon:yes stop_codon:yes gene_type:complete